MSGARRIAIPIEIQLQVSSEDWLEVHGLSSQHLTLDQILPTLGFHQSTDYVKSLQRDVPSQYADGLFIQHHDSSGKIYNLCNATTDGLSAIENDLQESLTRLKARHDWLTSGSRSTFGVICEKKVVVMMDICASEHTQLEPFLDVLVSTIREQLVHVDQFNLIKCTDDLQKWRQGLTENTEENITNAIQWVEQTNPQTTLGVNVVEGLVMALTHLEAEAVYILAHEEDTLRAFELLLDKVSPSLIPVHVVVYNCKSLQAQDRYKQLAAAAGGRFHTTCPPHSPALQDKANPPLLSISSLRSAGNSQSSQRLSSVGSASPRVKAQPQSAVSTNSVQSSISPPLSEDVSRILAEIELTRETLAEVQALRLEVRNEADDVPSVTVQETVAEDSLTSQQWLQVNGLEAKKLCYKDFVNSIAFHHCNGTVQIPVPKHKSEIQAIEVVPHTRVVHAQYCKDFLHIRLSGVETVHVQMAPRRHKLYQRKVEDVCVSCVERLAWLKGGSRELFGTLLENKVVVVVDTSFSLKERLPLIKHKVKQLLEEQLSQKEAFMLAHFNTAMHPWRIGLVPTSPHNLEAVGQWMDGLCAEGTTNTQEALEVAMTVQEAEGVYLLTDGRPDQPAHQILARVQQLPKIPVHTISFNCADSKANTFLAQLSKNTGGRYYYYSEDTADPEGPKSYESEDIQMLKDEIEFGKEQLQLADHLLAECMATRKRGRRREEEGKSTTVSPTGPGKKRFKKTSKQRDNELTSSEKWLEKNSLSALNLGLMDAFGPASIPLTSKHVPLLGKKVSSTVFSSLFPLAHIANNHRVTLIHPNGVNLSDYERRLDKQIEAYQSRIACLAWSAIPEDTRGDLAVECGMGVAEEPGACVYVQHRERLRAAMTEGLRPQEDFDLLEHQIELGENFKKYLMALKKEGTKKMDASLRRSGSGSSNNDEQVNGKFSVSESSLVTLMDKLCTMTPLASPQHRLSLPPSSTLHTASQQSVLALVSQQHVRLRSTVSRYPRGQKVVVRSEEDGFYYPGFVRHSSGNRHMQVELLDKQLLNARQQDIIPMGGAEPCPLLGLKDFVLVRVRTHHGPHPSSSNGLCDYYIPGAVIGLPDNIRRGHAFYSVLVFNGKSVTCPRRGIIKINRSRYSQVSKYIKDMLSCPSSLRPVFCSTSLSCKSHSTLTTSKSGSHSISSSHIITVHVPTIRDSSPLSSCNGASSTIITPTPTLQTPFHSGSTTPTLQTPSHSGSTTPTLRTPSHSGSTTDKEIKYYLESMACNTGSHSRSKSGPNSDLQQLLELHKMQEALLEQQKGELAAMHVQQKELQCELRTRKEEDMQRAKRLQRNSVHDEGIQTENGEEMLVTPTVAAPAATPTWMASFLPPAPLTLFETSWPHCTAPECHSGGSATCAEVCETGMNTETWTEEKGMGTDPLTESWAVGTEWSESGLDSSTETDLTSTTLDKTSPDNTIDLQEEVVEEVKEEEEEDPLINEHVLARWPDDGWYYRGVIVRSLGGMWYVVADAGGDMETIHALDIIIDLHDGQRPLEVGESVACLHPCYDCSYAPGKVVGIDNGIHFSVQLYDKSQVLLPRHEVYHLALAKHQRDVEYLQQREAAWVGLAVVARRDRDGFYLPGRVVEQLDGVCQYLIKWADGSCQTQDIMHMFGELTRRRSLRQGHHVLAIAIPAQGVCLPATITGRIQNQLSVKFCDGQNSLVNPTQCFWLCSEYYQEAVKFIVFNVSSSSSSNVHSASDNGFWANESDRHSSEYSASYY